MSNDTVDRRTAVGTLAAASLGILFGGAMPVVSRAQRARALPPGAAVVLVHGAWADGSDWQRVVLPLERQGLKVVCAPIPLTSLSDDIAAVAGALERTTGPVVLAGHAYAGGVIGATHHARVKALVYIAALAPAEGETVAQVFYRDKAHPEQPKLVPDARGFIWIPDDGFQRAVAHKATPDEARILTAVQRPIALKAIQEKSPATAWPTTPVWYLVAEEDRMINPITQRFMAARMQARVRAFPVDHSPEITAPSHVVDILMEAVQATLPQAAGA
jgi:pimeloyl-ACP methyl ester carboxylesterase